MDKLAPKFPVPPPTSALPQNRMPHLLLDGIDHQPLLRIHLLSIYHAPCRKVSSTAQCFNSRCRTNASHAFTQIMVSEAVCVCSLVQSVHIMHAYSYSKNAHNSGTCVSVLLYKFSAVSLRCSCSQLL